MEPYPEPARIQVSQHRQLAAFGQLRMFRRTPAVFFAPAFDLRKLLRSCSSPVRLCPDVRQLEVLYQRGFPRSLRTLDKQP